MDSVDKFLADSTTPILPKIFVEPTIEVLVKLHIIISRNVASVASNLGGGRIGHLLLTITTYYYLAQKCHSFVPPHNPGDYHPLMGTVQ